TAAALTNPPTPTRAAPRTASRARVPFVVVNTTVRSRTRAGVYSAGELPHSNPAGGAPPRSPPTRAAPPGQSRARALASSGVATGITARAPPASAATIVVDARTTSRTTAVTPASGVAATSSSVSATSINWAGRPGRAGRGSGGGGRSGG